MMLPAVPARLVCLTDGVYNGKQHTLLYTQLAGDKEPLGLAIPPEDAKELASALKNIIPAAQQVQDSYQSPGRLVRLDGNPWDRYLCLLGVLVGHVGIALAVAGLVGLCVKLFGR